MAEVGSISWLAFLLLTDNNVNTPPLPRHRRTTMMDLWLSMTASITTTSPPSSPVYTIIHSPLQTPTYLSLDSLSPSSSPSPSRRPALSRTSSVSSMALAEADESFSQLTLLDLLVALDAHVDLASREIKKKGKEWRNKANSTAISVKRQAGEVISNQRRLRRRVAGGNGGFASSNRQDVDNNDDEQYEQGDVIFDRELQRFREKVCLPRVMTLIEQLNTLLLCWTCSSKAD